MGTDDFFILLTGSLAYAFMETSEHKPVGCLSSSYDRSGRKRAVLTSSYLFLPTPFWLFTEWAKILRFSVLLIYKVEFSSLPFWRYSRFSYILPALPIRTIDWWTLGVSYALEEKDNFGLKD